MCRKAVDNFKEDRICFQTLIVWNNKDATNSVHNHERSGLMTTKQSRTGAHSHVACVANHEIQNFAECQEHHEDIGTIADIIWNVVRQKEDEHVKIVALTSIMSEASLGEAIKLKDIIQYRHGRANSNQQQFG